MLSHNAGQNNLALFSVLTSGPSRPCDGGLEKRELDPEPDLPESPRGAVRLYWGRIDVGFRQESDDGRVWVGFQCHLCAGGVSASVGDKST